MCQGLSDPFTLAAIDKPSRLRDTQRLRRVMESRGYAGSRFHLESIPTLRSSDKLIEGPVQHLPTRTVHQ